MVGETILSLAPGNRLNKRVLSKQPRLTFSNWLRPTEHAPNMPHRKHPKAQWSAIAAALLQTRGGLEFGSGAPWSASFSPSEPLFWSCNNATGVDGFRRDRSVGWFVSLLLLFLLFLLFLSLSLSPFRDRGLGL